MVQITTPRVAELSDPKLRQIAQRIIRTFELGVEKVAAHHAAPTRFPLARDAGTIEAILNARFETLPSTKKQAAATAATQRIQAAANTRKSRFGDLVAVDQQSEQPIEAQAQALSFPDALKLPPSFMSSLSVGSAAMSASAAAAAAPSPVGKLEFLIHEVQCNDETGSWPSTALGSDEMSCCGMSVDENGGSQKIPPIEIGSFDTGDVKKYESPLRFCNFNLKEGNAWPKSYFVTLVMAEVDMGGLSDFVNGLFKKVRAEVKAALIAAFGSVGLSGGPVGAVIGVVVGYVVAEVFALLRRIWEDDVFSPATLEIDISSPNHRFPGNRLQSPKELVTFVGHGGVYNCTVNWAVSP